jgi:hypothetical protein
MAMVLWLCYRDDLHLWDTEHVRFGCCWALLAQRGTALAQTRHIRCTRSSTSTASGRFLVKIRPCATVLRVLSEFVFCVRLSSR